VDNIYKDNLTVPEIMALIKKGLENNNLTDVLVNSAETESVCDTLGGEHEKDDQLDKMSQHWWVHPHRPVESHKRRLQFVHVFLKKIIRKLLKWYINPPFEEQSRFNDMVVRYLKRVNIHLSELDKKLADIDRDATISYLNFENNFRGQSDVVKRNQEVYLPYFLNRKNVLDVGCGRGEFVELLVSHGVSITGLDVNEEMVCYCRDKGLPVFKEDFFDFLAKTPNESLDGVFMAQVIEHLKPYQMVEAVNLVYEKLTHGSYFVLETINPESLYVFAHSFYIDLTHVRPLHPQTAKFIFESNGFSEVALLYSGFVDGSKQVPFIDASQNLISNIQELNQGIERLNKLIYGPQDYAVIGRK